MGIYDRDYYRQAEPAFSVRAPGTIIGRLILINVVVFLANGLLTSGTNLITDLLAAHSSTIFEPWMWWQFLSYGFAHDPSNWGHILFNMLGLWFLGRDIELTYGRKEFLWLYLVMLVVGSLSWSIVNVLRGVPAGVDFTLVGASGAVVGIVVLFALHFPRRTLLLFFVLPVPAWLVGVLLVAGDLLGTFGTGRHDVAYSVHLAGAAFAFLYYRFGWNLGRLVEGRFSWVNFKRRPKLRIHDPPSEDAELSNQVDRILEKIHREGEGSLTRKERRTLENASREYQRRRQ